jgi:hypothetical protein
MVPVVQVRFLRFGIVFRGGYVLDVGSVADTFEALGADPELVTDAQE